MTPVARNGRLSVDGPRLINAHGAPVQLRGMSLFWSQWGGNFYTAEWVRRLARDWRVDAVRACLGVFPDGYLAEPSRERGKITCVIDAAISEGIYVIVDWHSHRAETAAATSFFAGLAAQYGGHANLLYETWNEPGDEDWRSAIVPHHREVISALRGAGADGVAICGTGFYCQDLASAAAAPLELENACYAVHFYAGTHRHALRGRIDNARRAGLCIFASEYGLSESSGDGVVDLPEAHRWWDFLDERGISCVNWSLHDKQEASAALCRRSLSRLVGFGRTHSGQAVRRYLAKSHSLDK